MITRILLPATALGLLLCGCSQHQDKPVVHPAFTNPRNNRYELASRMADPLANYGAGTSAGIPDNPTVGNYPGPLTPLVTPLMAVGN